MREDTLQRKNAEYCKENYIQGVLRVTVCGEVKHAQAIGFADIQNSVPFTSESMFTLYSLSKPFCAIGLLKLKDKGCVDLDSHPSRYVPEAEGFDAAVTIRHLLHHISGLPDFEQNRDFAQKKPYKQKNATHKNSFWRERGIHPPVFDPIVENGTITQLHPMH